MSQHVTTADGRTLVVHDSGLQPAALTLVWHIGSPQTGALLAPVAEAAAARGIRLVSYGRPSYGGSTANPGRDVASAGSDVETIVDALGVDRFAVMGASGGGPHALACAALLPGRVSGVVTLASPAPYTEAFDWTGGMAAPGGLLAALRGRDSRATFAETDEFEPTSFIPADYAMFDGPWQALGDDVEAAAEWGDDGLIDDDVAFTRPWGFDLSRVTAPTLLIQGLEDAVIPFTHAASLLALLPQAERWEREGDGHISILREVPACMDWLLSRP